MKKFSAVMISIAMLLTTVAAIRFIHTTLNTQAQLKKQRSNGLIRPNDISTKQRRNDITKAFELWKEQYVKQVEGHPEQYYVSYDNDDNTVSEAHGYGMLTMVMMEKQFHIKTKQYFDGMYAYAKDHPSDQNPSFMSWKQYRQKDGSMVDDKSRGLTDSATDGDMDIAYSLLLADQLWGSDGKINYKQEANLIINALMDTIVNHKEWTLKLGDWVRDNDPKFGTASRTSDWMVGHIDTFYKVTGDERWKKVLDRMKEIITHIQDTYSSETGLLPEFVVKKGGEWVPVRSYFLEGKTDPYYSYNACRVPWRLASGYFLTKDEKLKQQLAKMNEWIMEATNGNPSSIKAGYKLDGQPLALSNNMAFIAPFAASAAIDEKNQEWLNRLWKQMTKGMGSNHGSKYYSDSIRLLVMLFMEEAVDQ